MNPCEKNATRASRIPELLWRTRGSLHPFTMESCWDPFLSEVRNTWGTIRTILNGQTLDQLPPGRHQATVLPESCQVLQVCYGETGWVSRQNLTEAQCPEQRWHFQSVQSDQTSHRLRLGHEGVEGELDKEQAHHIVNQQKEEKVMIHMWAAQVSFQFSE